MIDLRLITKIDVFTLPGREQVFDLSGTELRERQIVPRALIARAEIAVLNIVGTIEALVLDGITAPRPILTMRRHDHPFFA